VIRGRLNLLDVAEGEGLIEGLVELDVADLSSVCGVV